jgi:hypothetical protein
MFDARGPLLSVRPTGAADDPLNGPYARFWRPQIAPLAPHVVQAVAAGPLAPTALLPFSAAPTLLDTGEWPVETGYTLSPEGDARVFVRTLMPGVTPPMWDWWFSWHGEDARYRLWHPHAHLTARWADGLGDLGTYVGRTSNVDEYIGAALLKLSIRFVAPETLGLDRARLGAGAGQVAICARGSRRDAPFDFSWLIHHVRAIDGGSEMRSRFWLGGPNVEPKRANGRLGRLAARAVARIARPSRDEAVDLLVHCAQEMNHLAGILPDLYATFGPPKPGASAP